MTAARRSRLDYEQTGSYRFVRRIGNEKRARVVESLWIGLWFANARETGFWEVITRIPDGRSATLTVSGLWSRSFMRMHRVTRPLHARTLAKKSLSAVVQ